LLHDLICKIERICVGFGNHKQDVFNLVQALKTLFLYTQSEKESIKEYKLNFKSLWETVEAFGGSPGVSKGLVNGLLAQTGQVGNPGSLTAAERKQAEVNTSEVVKAVLLISGANKQQYGKLKDELTNNYLLGSDQYPDMDDKALRILGHYQVSGMRLPAVARTESGPAFLQR
jgi:hypothetical protein